jgi:hypothetical protein
MNFSILIFIDNGANLLRKIYFSGLLKGLKYLIEKNSYSLIANTAHVSGTSIHQHVSFVAPRGSP